MKRFTLSIIAILMIALQANAMSLSQARNEARFLTDKMYYELDLTEAQYNYVYEINFDYFYDLNHYRDAYGYLWNRRNEDLGYVLDRWQYNHYIAIEYFYRPVAWVANTWSFVIYSHYRNDLFFYGTPHHYTTYIGSHGWRTNGGRSYFRTHRYHMPANHRHIAAPRRPEAGHAPRPRVVVGAGHGGHHNINHRREEALRRENERIREESRRREEAQRRENNRIREEARRREEAQRRENERIREESRRREEAQRRENERVREEARRREEAQRRENERIREESRRREEAQRRENERRREEAQRQENRRREEAQRREENRRREEAQKREENRRREEAQRQENRRREEAQRQENRRREEAQRRENERRQSDNNRTTRSSHTGGRR